MKLPVAGPEMLRFKVLTPLCVAALIVSLLVAVAPGASAQVATEEQDTACQVDGAEMTLAEARVVVEQCAEVGPRLGGLGCEGINFVSREFDLGEGYSSLPDDELVTVSVVFEASSCVTISCSPGSQEARLTNARIIAKACTVTADECGTVERAVLIDDEGASDGTIVTLEIVEISCTGQAGAAGDLQPDGSPSAVAVAPTVAPATAPAIIVVTPTPMAAATTSTSTAASATLNVRQSSPSTTTSTSFGFRTGSTASTAATAPVAPKAAAVSFTG